MSFRRYQSERCDNTRMQVRALSVCHTRTSPQQIPCVSTLGCQTPSLSVPSVSPFCHAGAGCRKWTWTEAICPTPPTCCGCTESRSRKAWNNKLIQFARALRKAAIWPTWHLAISNFLDWSHWSWSGHQVENCNYQLTTGPELRGGWKKEPGSDLFSDYA